MKFQPIRNEAHKITGYKMTLSATDTNEWAQTWPGSQTNGRVLWLEVDSSGICDANEAAMYAGYELEAIVSDFLPDEAAHLWPVWGQRKFA